VKTEMDHKAVDSQSNKETMLLLPQEPTPKRAKHISSRLKKAKKRKLRIGEEKQTLNPVDIKEKQAYPKRSKLSGSSSLPTSIPADGSRKIPCEGSILNIVWDDGHTYQATVSDVTNGVVTVVFKEEKTDCEIHWSSHNFTKYPIDTLESPVDMER